MTGDVRLADLTTIRVGGPAARFVPAESAEELVDAVGSADSAGEPVLLVAGGSNLLVGDQGIPGVVVAVRSRGIEVDSLDACSGASVTVAAGHPWDEFVAHAVGQEWIGLEALSGIPGSVGATPIQNVGAYGQEVASTISAVHCYDRRERRRVRFAAADCGFGYRHSRFKAEPARYLVLAVSFQFRLGDLGEPVRYAELARTLGVETGQRVAAAKVRDAVLGLRRGKGMVLDDADHDTWSCGSFFTNPVIAAGQLPDGAPQYPAPGGAVKTSAAWLIEKAGFAKGFGMPGPAALSTKHTLALTNRGGATASDVLELARRVRDGVRETYGITLVPEPVLAGCSLD